VSSSAAERRAKQTIRNLIYSMLVTLALTIAIVLVVPRDDGNRIQPIDYQEIAISAESSIDEEILTPAIPDNWWANAARIEKDLNVQTWYIGFVTQDNQYIGLTQAFDSNPSWLANKLQGNWLDDVVTIGNREWEIWPTLNPSVPKGTKEYAMVHNYGNKSVVLYGTASEEDFRILASTIGQELDEEN
jgi:hypothetical protein